MELIDLGEPPVDQLLGQVLPLHQEHVHLGVGGPVQLPRRPGLQLGSPTPKGSLKDCGQSALWGTLTTEKTLDSGTPELPLSSFRTQDEMIASLQFLTCHWR